MSNNGASTNPSSPSTGSGGSSDHVDFTVTIAASALVSLASPHDNGAATPRVIHALSVIQPVQSWTVIRDHVDFMTMDVSLGGVVSGLPRCPGLPSAESTHGGGGGDSSDNSMNAVITARNGAQEWLSTALTVPSVRSSPVMQQFLCYGANIVPPQFEGVGWVNFGHQQLGGGGGHGHVPQSPSAASRTSQQHHHPQSSPSHLSGSSHNSPHSHHAASYAAAVTGGSSNNNRSNPNLEEMEMDDMFEDEQSNDDSSNEDHDHYDDDDDDDDDASYLQNRFHDPSNPYGGEPLSPAEVMEIQQDCKEVEMVEDVGSLAQSMGASHLGRSLGLQREMMSAAQQQGGGQNNRGQQGINILSNNGNVAPSISSSTSSPGGIGSAMAKAAAQGDAPGGVGGAAAAAVGAHVQGLGDSFYRTAPVSAPRLDSFKMIKVVGKGSFGE